MEKKNKIKKIYVRRTDTFLFSNLTENWKIKKEQKSAISAYNQSKRWLDLLISCAKNDEEKRLVIDYVIEILKRDLQYDTMSRIIYNNKQNFRFLFPYQYLDQDGDMKSIFCEEEEKEIDLSKDFILSCPWNYSRLPNALGFIKRDSFKFMENNHFGMYFKPIDLCLIYNGYHSITSGIYLEQGTITIKKVYDITPLFSNVFTDGYHWYSVHTNEILFLKIEDFRIAILFEAAKAKFDLHNKLEIMHASTIDSR